MRFDRFAPAGLALAMTAVPLVSGCAVAALAPAVMQGGSLVNGSSANKVQVTLDEKTFTPAVRDSLAGAKNWAVAVVRRADIKMVDAIETRGGFHVSVDRPQASQGEMTSSERRDTLRKMCAEHKSDVSLLPHAGATETGNVWAAAFTGRANVSQVGWIDVLECRGNVSHSFDYTIALDTGIWAHQPRNQMEDDIAAQVANTLLVALGK